MPFPTPGKRQKNITLYQYNIITIRIFHLSLNDFWLKIESKYGGKFNRV